MPSSEKTITFERHVVSADNGSSVAALLRDAAAVAERLEERTDGEIIDFDLAALDTTVRWAAVTFRQGDFDGRNA